MKIVTVWIVRQGMGKATFHDRKYATGYADWLGAPPPQPELLEVRDLLRDGPDWTPPRPTRARAPRLPPKPEALAPRPEQLGLEGWTL